MKMDFRSLIGRIEITNAGFLNHAAKSIDQLMTIRNWLIGAYIMEYEQNGADRATYGSKLEENIANRISEKGLSARNLKLFKQFYKAYTQMRQTLSASLEKTNDKLMQTLSAQLLQQKENTSDYPISVQLLCDKISFSHFVELIKINDPNKRLFYEVQIIQGTWSVRELKKQVNKLTYERSASADHPEHIIAALSKDAELQSPELLIKTPYVFDFLKLPDSILVSETELESALIADLKNFMLELGHGFCFEAQQKRIVIGGEYFFIDLVFYHRILKCHVLVELKIDEFSHQYAGQINTYLQYYKQNVMMDSDNLPVGILLCTNKNTELVEFALGGMDKNLFVSQYQTVLPTQNQLQRFLQNEKEKIEGGQNE